MPEGIVKSFDSAKGGGIIATEQGEEISVHRSAILADQSGNLYPGDIVEFTLGRNKWGKPAALNVRRIGWEEEGKEDVPREWNF